MDKKLFSLPVIIDDYFSVLEDSSSSNDEPSSILPTTIQENYYFDRVPLDLKSATSVEVEKSAPETPTTWFRLSIKPKLLKKLVSIFSGSEMNPKKMGNIDVNVDGFGLTTYLMSDPQIILLSMTINKENFSEFECLKDLKTKVSLEEMKGIISKVVDNDDDVMMLVYKGYDSFTFELGVAPHYQLKFLPKDDQNLINNLPAEFQDAIEKGRRVIIDVNTATRSSMSGLLDDMFKPRLAIIEITMPNLEILYHEVETTTDVSTVITTKQRRSMSFYALRIVLDPNFYMGSIDSSATNSNFMKMLGSSHSTVNTLNRGSAHARKKRVEPLSNINLRITDKEGMSTTYRIPRITFVTRKDLFFMLDLMRVCHELCHMDEITSELNDTNPMSNYRIECFGGSAELDIVNGNWRDMKLLLTDVQATLQQ